MDAVSEAPRAWVARMYPGGATQELVRDLKVAVLSSQPADKTRDALAELIKCAAAQAGFASGGYTAHVHRGPVGIVHGPRHFPVSRASSFRTRGKNDERGGDI